MLNLWAGITAGIILYRGFPGQVINCFHRAGNQRGTEPERHIIYITENICLKMLSYGVGWWERWGWWGSKGFRSCKPTSFYPSIPHPDGRKKIWQYRICFIILVTHTIWGIWYSPVIFFMQIPIPIFSSTRYPADFFGWSWYPENLPDPPITLLCNSPPLMALVHLYAMVFLTFKTQSWHFCHRENNWYILWYIPFLIWPYFEMFEKMNYKMQTVRPFHLSHIFLMSQLLNARRPDSRNLNICQ